MARRPSPTNPSYGQKRRRTGDGEASSSESDFAVEDANLYEIDPDYVEEIPKPKKKPKARGQRRVSRKWEIMEDEDNKWIDEHQDDPPDADVIAEKFEEPSSAITLPLLRFQKEFLYWALNMEQSHVRGGILADEMGMGKTIQAIALVVTARDRRSSRDQEPESSAARVGATLVICPVVAVIQWAGEIERYTERGSTRVLVYHGAKRAKCEYDFNKYDFVITTYQTIEWDYRKNIMPLGLRCQYCGKKYAKRNLQIHMMYFCGPNARKTEKQAKQKKKKEVDDGKGKWKGKGKGMAKSPKEMKVEDASVEGVRGVSLLHSVNWERIILDEVIVMVLYIILEGDNRLL